MSFTVATSLETMCENIKEKLVFFWASFESHAAWVPLFFSVVVGVVGSPHPTLSQVQEDGFQAQNHHYTITHWDECYKINK